MDKKMILNESGEIVRQEWQRTSAVRDEIKLDEFVIMSNHIHGIVIISGHDGVGATGRSPLPEESNGPQKRSLGSLIAGFKSIVTKRINQLRNIPTRDVWQRNFYDHIIRDEHSLQKIREYIRINPAVWEYDHNHIEVPFR